MLRSRRLLPAILFIAAAALSLPGPALGQNAPVITTTDTTVTVAENISISTVIKTYMASDGGDGDTLSWSLDGNDADDFNINSSTGALTFATIPDFETPKGSPATSGDPADNTYEITVKVQDNETPAMSDTLAVVVTVTDVNEHADLTTTTDAYDFDENGTTAVATFEATDPDSGFDLTWTLTGADADDFEISEDENDTDQDGVLSFKNPPDFESPAGSPAMMNDPADNTYELTVNVRDSKADDGMADTAIDESLNIVVTVTDANDKPKITGGDTAISKAENTGTSVTLGTYTATDEDSPAQTLSWSLEGNDAGDFNIDSSGGTLTFSSAPDFETPGGSPAMMNGDPDNTYEITVKVTDNGSPAMSDTLAVVVTVTDVNDAPRITTTVEAYDYAENGTGNVATFEATDPDAMATLTWSLSGNDAGDFNLTKDTNGDGVLTFNSSPNFESPAGSPGMGETNPDTTYEITVQVTDSKDGNGNTDTAIDDTLAVVVTVTDVNEAPSITTTDTTKSVAENTKAVITFAASDVDNNGETNDSNNTLTWSVESDEDGGKFSIDSSSGALTFTNAPDFENPSDVGDTAMNNTYVVTVKVTDNGIEGNRGSSNHQSDTHKIIVTVTDANDAPTITGGDAAISKAENTLTTVTLGTYTASDEDSPTQTLSWSLEGNDAMDFNIDSSAGTLTFSSSPDFETPGGSPAMTGDPADNTYEIKVKVTDNGSPAMSTTRDVVVTVTNVNEKPDITTDGATDKAPSFAEIEFDVDTSAFTAGNLLVHTYTADDPDAGASLTWSISGTDAGSFDIGSSSGKLSFKTTAIPDHENPADVADSMMMGAANNEYKVTVEVTDGLDDSGAAETPKVVDDSIDVTVTVTNVDEKPEITTTEAMTHTAPSFVEIEYDTRRRGPSPPRTRTSRHTRRVMRRTRT